jgi:GNAT superfamily N-acetyltransferase
MADAITLRVADVCDADAIRRLTREAYAKWVPVTGREPLPMRADYTQALKNHRFDLLYADGDLAALIETVPDGDAMLIVNIAVATTMQGRGFGTLLLQHAEELASSTGLQRTRLCTNKLFSENIRLYQARGYRFDREEPLNSGVAIHMSKAIAQR